MYISFTQDIIDKISKGTALMPNEKQIFDKHTEVACKLLTNVPRLEKVADIIRYQGKHYDGRGEPKGNMSKSNIPLGSRILHAALDFEVIVHDIGNPLKAIEEIRFGMIFAQDVVAENGQRIAGKGQEATDAIISRIKNIATRIKIKEPINVFVKKEW